MRIFLICIFLSWLVNDRLPGESLLNRPVPARLAWERALQAIRENDVPALEKFSTNLSDLSDQDEDGMTLLMHAAARGQTPSVLWLVGKKAELNLTDQTGATALCYAAKSGDVKACEALLNAGAKTDGHREQIYPAAMANPKLIENRRYNGGLPGGNQMVPLEIVPGPQAWSAVEESVAHDHLEVLKLLVGKGGVNLKERDRWFSHKMTALGVAAKNGAEGIAAWLIANGYGADEKDGHGATALLHAAASANTGLVRLLLEKGADVNAYTLDFYHRTRATALSAAAFNNDLEMIRLLLDKGATIEVSIPGRVSKLSALKIADSPGMSWEAWHLLREKAGDTSVPELRKDIEAALEKIRREPMMETTKFLPGLADTLSKPLAQAPDAPRTQAPATSKVDKIRVAVVGDGPDAGILADLLMVELGRENTVQLLERNDIERVVKERGLRPFLSTGSSGREAEIGALLGADALILLQPLDAAQKLLMQKMVAVKTGLILGISYHELPLAEPDKLAHTNVTRFLQILPKMRPAPGSAVAISVQGFADQNLSPENRSLAKAMELLVKRRLAAESDVFLLEREQLEQLSREKAFSGQSAGEGLWAGGYLLEAGVEPHGYESEIKLNWRVTALGSSKKTDGSVSGKAYELPLLAEKIGSEILKAFSHSPSTIKWDPQAEGLAYLTEAQRLYALKRPGDALQNVETAWNVGLRSMECAAWRYRVATAMYSMIHEVVPIFNRAAFNPEIRILNQRARFVYWKLQASQALLEMVREARNSNDLLTGLEGVSLIDTERSGKNYIGPKITSEYRGSNFLYEGAESREAWGEEWKSVQRLNVAVCHRILDIMDKEHWTEVPFDGITNKKPLPLKEQMKFQHPRLKRMLRYVLSLMEVEDFESTDFVALIRRIVEPLSAVKREEQKAVIEDWSYNFALYFPMREALLKHCASARSAAGFFPIYQLYNTRIPEEMLLSKSHYAPLVELLKQSGLENLNMLGLGLESQLEASLPKRNAISKEILAHVWKSQRSYRTKLYLQDALPLQWALRDFGPDCDPDNHEYRFQWYCPLAGGEETRQPHPRDFMPAYRSNQPFYQAFVIAPHARIISPIRPLWTKAALERWPAYFVRLDEQLERLQQLRGAEGVKLIREMEALRQDVKNLVARIPTGETASHLTAREAIKPIEPSILEPVPNILVHSHIERDGDKALTLISERQEGGKYPNYSICWWKFGEPKITRRIALPPVDEVVLELQRIKHYSKDGQLIISWSGSKNWQLNQSWTSSEHYVFVHRMISVESPNGGSDSRSEVLVLDKATGGLRSCHDLPTYSIKLIETVGAPHYATARDRLYFFIGDRGDYNKNTPEALRVMELDAVTGKIEILSDINRKPAQSPMDAAKMNGFDHIYYSKEHHAIGVFRANSLSIVPPYAIPPEFPIFDLNKREWIPCPREWWSNDEHPAINHWKQTRINLLTYGDTSVEISNGPNRNAFFSSSLPIYLKREKSYKPFPWNYILAQGWPLNLHFTINGPGGSFFLTSAYPRKNDEPMDLNHRSDKATSNFLPTFINGPWLLIPMPESKVRALVESVFEKSTSTP